MAVAVPVGSVAPLADLTGVAFRHQSFLDQLGGSLVVQNVFEYFAVSPFYDRTCSNEQLRMKSIHPLDTSQLLPMLGLEYVLHISQPPHLFVFRKQYRRSPSEVVPVTNYTILDGTVYQAPTLYGVLGSRLARAAHHIGRVFAQSAERMEGVDKGDKGREGEQKGGADEGEPVGKAKEEMDPREVARVDQIFASVFSKLPPAPPPPIPKNHVSTKGSVPPGSLVEGGTPPPPMEAVGNGGKGIEGGEGGDVFQGPLKRQKMG